MHEIKTAKVHPFEVNSTGKCERGPMYHLTVGICANRYPFAYIPICK